MQYTQLGRTGLRVSVLGLGGGGHSRLGQQTGRSADQSVAVVQRALALGVNFFDTAEAYRTEELVGSGLRGVPRDQVVISTKKSPTANGQPISAAELRSALEGSLQRLGIEYVDIYHLHGVRENQYDRAVEELVPEMLRLREQGKLRFLGITEAFGADTGHAMLSRAVHDDWWDVVMVGFNILNQTARERVLATTQRRKIGTLCMFAVRDALSRPAKLAETVEQLLQNGRLDASAIDTHDPLGFVREVAASMPDAAYRFCRAEAGLDVILSGTGSVEHLEQNVKSVLAPPLPADVHQRLVALFEGIDTVSGQ
ncbi:MAG TPA: aldo/keto reductase [Roseiflexaceae bacterium]|nr:aldo/keto reductase [Roseiflexaceae bacterium]